MKQTLGALPGRAAAGVQQFFEFEAAGGVLLVLAMLLALVCANSPWQGYYDALISVPVEVRVGALQIAKPLLLWVNDGLMAVFFLLVALEIKREAICGHLATREQRVLPLACAGGGVALPALVYALLNRDDPAALAGWAIPTATDIAFALGILSLLGSRVPLALKVLLSAIAVIDDLAAIVIIATFYTAELSSAALLGAGGALLVLLALNRCGVRRVSAYVLVGVVMWVCVLKSGVHATLAGVATGLFIPLGDPGDPDDAPLRTLEHALHPWVAYGILPLFAFANAGLNLSGLGWNEAVQPVPLGIALGLLLGKPIGVFGAAAAVLAMRGARLPQGITLGALFGMALLCGIGFTMSLFIGSLAFAPDAPYALAARAGILLGSGAAALLGTLWLLWVLPRTAASS